MSRNRFESGCKQLTFHLAGAPEENAKRNKRSKMSIGMILLIVLVLALVGAIPDLGSQQQLGLWAPAAVSDLCS